MCVRQSLSWSLCLALDGILKRMLPKGRERTFHGIDSVKTSFVHTFEKKKEEETTKNFTESYVIALALIEVQRCDMNI